MNHWLSIDIILFASGMISTLILTPVFRRIAAATGFMDVPAANHKGHRKATPLLGGAAINDFMLIIGLGIVVGSYSSLYLAAPVVVWYRARRSKSSGAARSAG